MNTLFLPFLLLIAFFFFDSNLITLKLILYFLKLFPGYLSFRVPPFENIQRCLLKLFFSATPCDQLDEIYYAQYNQRPQNNHNRPSQSYISHAPSIIAPAHRDNLLMTLLRAFFLLRESYHSPKLFTT